MKTHPSQFCCFKHLVERPSLDGEAKNADKRFSHVAIAVDERFALEAVPDSAGTDGEKEIAAWSGVELDPGVRLIPLEDVYVPAWRLGTALVVLRNESLAHFDAGKLDQTVLNPG